MRVVTAYPLERFGLLPLWIIEHKTSIKQSLLDNYCCYMGPMNGGTLTIEGIYSYPGDPDLVAEATFETEHEICFIFAHAIVGVIHKDTGESWVTRMD